jgi:hypothetical protein
MIDNHTWLNLVVALYFIHIRGAFKVDSTLSMDSTYLLQLYSCMGSKSDPMIDNSLIGTSFFLAVFQTKRALCCIYSECDFAMCKTHIPNTTSV